MNADLIARPYALLERITFGSQLQKCRTAFIDRCPQKGRALLLGDGDGRFLVELARRRPQLDLLYVDSSKGMCQLAQCRHAHSAGPKAKALFQIRDVTKELPAGPFDLISAHFFFDCFDQPTLDALARQLTGAAAPGALLLFSDFRIPNSGPPRWLGVALVGLLYRAFQMLTGLRTQRLPDHHQALSAAGWLVLQHTHRCLGLLSCELWELSAQGRQDGSVS